MPKQSDIAKTIEDPTAQLTQAQIDPLGSAQAAAGEVLEGEAKAWVDQGGPALRRLGRRENVNVDADLRREALAHAVTAAKDSGEDVLVTAKAFYSFLKGEASGDAS